MSANAAYTDPVYAAFTDSSTRSNYTEVQAADIPRVTANLWTSIKRVAGLPLEIGGGVRYISNRPVNTTNTLILDSTRIWRISITQRRLSSVNPATRR